MAGCRKCSADLEPATWREPTLPDERAAEMRRRRDEALAKPKVPARASVPSKAEKLAFCTKCPKLVMRPYRHCGGCGCVVKPPLSVFISMKACPAGHW